MLVGRVAETCSIRNILQSMTSAKTSAAEMGHVLSTYLPNLYLTDLGLAVLCKRDYITRSPTGTPHYQAPEGPLGMRAFKASFAHEIWSLAVTLLIVAVSICCDV